MVITLVIAGVAWFMTPRGGANIGDHIGNGIASLFIGGIAVIGVLIVWLVRALLR